MSQSRASTPDSLEVIVTHPNTITSNATLLSRRLLETVREDMRRLGEKLNNIDLAKEIVILALEKTMMSVEEENVDHELPETECGEGWSPVQRKMGGLSAKLGRLTEVMEKRVDEIGTALTELRREIARAEGRRPERNDREEVSMDEEAV